MPLKQLYAHQEALGMGLLHRFSRISLRHKLKLFYETMSPVENTKVLGIGTQLDANGEKATRLTDSYPWKNRYDLNLTPKDRVTFTAETLIATGERI